MTWNVNRRRLVDAAAITSRPEIACHHESTCPSDCEFIQNEGYMHLFERKDRPKPRGARIAAGLADEDRGHEHRLELRIRRNRDLYVRVTSAYLENEGIRMESEGCASRSSWTLPRATTTTSWPSTLVGMEASSGATMRC